MVANETEMIAFNRTCLSCDEACEISGRASAARARKDRTVRPARQLAVAFKNERDKSCLP